MERIYLTNDDGRDLKFTGELLAEVSSRRADESLWTELKLFRSKGGTLIGQEIGRSEQPDKRNKYRAKALDDIEDVLSFFGTKWLAKSLYSAANIDTAEEIE